MNEEGRKEEVENGKVKGWTTDYRNVYLDYLLEVYLKNQKNLKFKHVHLNRVIEANLAKFQAMPNKKNNLEQEKCVTNHCQIILFLYVFTRN